MGEKLQQVPVVLHTTIGLAIG